MMFAQTSGVETVILLSWKRGGKNPKSRARMLMRSKVSMHVESVVLLSKVQK